MTGRLYLIDATAFAYRAHHAITAKSKGAGFTRSDGFPVGALMTFCAMIWKVRREGVNGQGAPSHMAAVFDAGGPTFRKEIYPAYKGTRKPTPGALTLQFPKMKEAARAFGITVVEQAGFEADDIIATYADEAARHSRPVVILSSDKDLMQVLSPMVAMYDTMRDKLIDERECIAKFGVPPAQVVDVQAILGDTTDNVPGVPGIGVKTAADLVRRYMSLDAVLMAAADQYLSGDPTLRRAQAALTAHADKARLSKRLVTLKRDLPQEYPLSAFQLGEFDARQALTFLEAMEFKALSNRVAVHCGVSLMEVFDIAAQVAR